jgi:hypothetical protein
VRALELAAPILVGLAIAVSWAMVCAGGIAGVFAWSLALPFALPLLSLGLAGAALILGMWRRRLTSTTVACLIVAALGVWPAGWIFNVCLLPYPADVGDVKPAAVARLPAEGPLVVGWGGDDMAHNYHARAPDQRWAYDFVALPAAHGSKHLADYGCYGREVLAPTAGSVVVAHDGEPDVTPAEPPSNPRKPLGNHVALEIDGGSFLILAHLQAGSVAVREGQSVDEGAVLGRCGNSGNTSEPHIHVHHQRQDPRRFPVGFAEGLPLYFRLDGGVRMPEGGIHVESDGRIALSGEVVEHTP